MGRISTNELDIHAYFELDPNSLILFWSQVLQTENLDISEAIRQADAEKILIERRGKVREEKTLTRLYELE